MKQVTISVSDEYGIQVDNNDFADYELHGLLMNVCNHIIQQQNILNNKNFFKELAKDLILEFEAEENQEND